MLSNHGGGTNSAPVLSSILLGLHVQPKMAIVDGPMGEFVEQERRCHEDMPTETLLKDILTFWNTV